MATSQVLGFLISDFFVAIGCLIVAFYNSWQLTLVLMATIPVSVLVLHFISRGLEAAIDSQKKKLAQASKVIVAAVTAVDLVKVYNGFDHEVWQYLRLARGSMQHYIRQARRNALQMGFLKLWMVNLFVVGFWFSGYLVSKSMTTPGTALTTFYSTLTALQSITSVAPQWLVLAKGRSAGHQLQRIKLARPQGSCQSQGPHRPQSCAGEIELHDVSFAYPSSKQAPPYSYPSCLESYRTSHLRLRSNLLTHTRSRENRPQPLNVLLPSWSYFLGREKRIRQKHDNKSPTQVL